MKLQKKNHYYLTDCSTCTELLLVKKIICPAENVYFILTRVYRDAANKETHKGRLALIDMSVSQAQSLFIDIQPHIPEKRDGGGGVSQYS